MDQLRTSYLELQEKFKSCQEAESQAKTDNQILREESLMLRDKIVQLIKYVSEISMVKRQLIFSFSGYKNKTEKRIVCGNAVTDFYTCNGFRRQISGWYFVKIF